VRLTDGGRTCCMVPSSNIVPPSDDAYQLHIVESYIKVILPGDELSMIALSIFTLSTWRTTRAWSRALPSSWALRGGRWPGGGGGAQKNGIALGGVGQRRRTPARGGAGPPCQSPRTRLARTRARSCRVIPPRHPSVDELIAGLERRGRASARQLGGTQFT
jgi:hypothetical protein